jgi:hypothetical protein
MEELDGPAVNAVEGDRGSQATFAKVSHQIVQKFIIASSFVLLKARSAVTGRPRSLAARTARRRAVPRLRGMRHTDSHFCFSRRCTWLDKYVAMRLFQSLDASDGECPVARLLVPAAFEVVFHKSALGPRGGL